MPEMPDVVSGEIIESEWGNDIRDRTAQRYESVAERTSLNPSPGVGDLAFMETTGDLDVFYAGAWRHISGVPVGTILAHGGGSVPPGYLACNGAAVSRTTYSGLFGQIGTIWGAGDGSTTFALPDLRGKVARGVATASPGNSVGQTFGNDTPVPQQANPGATQAANLPGLVSNSQLSGDSTFGATVRHTHDYSPIQQSAAVSYIIKT